MAGRSAAFLLPFGPGAGLGHLVRSAALAERLKARGWTTVLVCEGDAPLPDFCAAAFSRRRRAGEATVPLDWLVIDHPSPGKDAASRLSAAGTRTLRVVDGTARRIPADDAVLNQNIRRAMEADHEGQMLLLGPSYATLRPAFARARPLAQAPAERQDLRRILIAPGATDVCRVANRLVPALVTGGLSVDVVLSSVAANLEAVRLLASAHPGQVRLVVDADDRTLAGLLAETDIVVGNGGVGSWERCTLGVPSVLLEMAPDQRENIAALTVAGAGVPAGHAAADAMPESVMGAIGDLCGDAECLRTMSSQAFGICDGLGANRVAAALDPVRLRDGAAVSLRRADEKDCRRVFDWQSLPETRRYARNPVPPAWEEHRRWFARKLADHRVVMNLIEVGATPAGVVRLDHDGEREGDPVYEVSIFLDPAFTGRGVATTALDAAAHLLPFAWFKAFVLPQNETSLRLFARAGYERAADAFYLQPRYNRLGGKERTL